MRDLLGKEAELRGKTLWLLDMDGTIYMEDRIFDGTLELLAEIRARGGRYVFITNNSSKSVTDYLNKVRAMGIPAGEEDFFTSAQAAVLLLQERFPGAKVYCQGTGSLVCQLREAGIEVTTELEPVDLVLTGFDTELTMEKLRRTCQILTEQKNVAYYATNPDLVCPASFGYVPDCGSMSVMIRNATGRYPIFIGKPEPTMIQIVMEKFGCGKEETVVVGDRVYTDIASGVRAGVDTIGVLSGEAKLKDFQSSDTPPKWIFRDVREIFQALTMEAP
ncbi:MAG: HAD-IIA family hydrolase [Oscillospiraceae bacterium]|nr:HAD-IIA family hydrolase [Oscillospiraceae bacterium]